MNEHRGSLPAETASFYQEAMRTLQMADVPFLVAGAFAFGHHTDIERHTKDLDLFLCEGDLDAALDALHGVGDGTERDFAHWIGKVHRGDDTLDLIYRTANGIATVDMSWFAHAPEEEVLGVVARLCPPEELLWTKAFIMERERYDGADVAHLLHACGPTLDWPRLLERFGRNWQVLLSHLVLFRFIYPGEADRIPADVVEALIDRLARDEPDADMEQLCRGTLLSRTQYRVDVKQWNYRDARLPPDGDVSPGDAAAWTHAGEAEEGDANDPEGE